MNKKVKFSQPSGPFFEPYTGKISSKLDPQYDNQEIDIFEGGPAGQVLVDIDPFYGGIQLQEDEKPGDQAMRDLARFAKSATDVLTPSEETQAEIAEFDKKEQDAFNMLLKATGYDPESFEASQLKGRLNTDRELRKLLNLPTGFFDRGLKEFKLDFARAGQFLFGEANKGLTTMTEEGTKFQDLPFDQKLGIAILPIDLLDAIGITYGGAQVLKTLIKGGVKEFGKTSGKTVTDLLSDEQFLSKIETDNPGFIKQLEELGIPPEAKFASGEKPVTPKGIAPMTPEQQRANLEQRVREIEQAQRDQQIKIDPDTGRPIVEGIKKVDTFEDIMKQRAKYLEDKKPIDAVILQTSKTQTKIDPLAPGRGKLGQMKYGNKDLVKYQVDEYDEALRVLESIPELNIGRNASRAEFKRAGQVYAQIVNGNDDILKVALRNYLPTGGQRGVRGGDRTAARIQNNAKADINDFAAWTDYKQKHPLRMGPSLIKARRLRNAITRIEDYKKNNPNSIGLEIDFKKMEEILSGDEYYANVFKDIDDAVLKATKEDTAKFKDLTLAEKRALIIENNYQDEFMSLQQYLKDSGLELGRPFRLRKKLKPEGSKKALNLTDSQLKDYNAKRDEINAAVKEQQDIPIRGEVVKDWLRGTTQRMRANYTDEAAILKLVKDIDSDKLAELLLKREKANMQAKNFMDEYEDIAKVFGGEFDPKQLEFQLGHIKALEDSIYASLDMENLFLQSAEANRLDNEVRGYIKGKINKINEQMQMGITEDSANAITELLDDLKSINEIAANEGVLTNVKGMTFGDTKLKESESIFSGDEDLFMNKGGLVPNIDNVFEEEEGTIFPKISIEFGEAAQGRAMAQPKLEKRFDEPLKRVSAKPLAAPQEKVFDTPPIENIFTGEVEQANLKLPFFKLFTKPPVNETAPIPTPKEALDNPTKKQLQSLEQEKLNKEQDFFDPTPEDNAKVDLGSSTDVATTPKTNQPLTGVFYSDAEKVLQRPDTPIIFPNKQALIDFFAKNRIKKTELEDYGINNLLKAFDDVTPIPKDAVIRQIRSAPVRGMHVHGTGKGSEIINPSGEKVNVAYEGYREDGFIPGTTSERVLYIPMDKLPGDTAGQPVSIFAGETIQNHGFGLPGGSDNNYVVGWTRLSERRALLPTKLDAPQGKSKIPGLTRERERAQRQVAGLYAEAINKLNREGVRRGLNQADLEVINQLSLEEMLSQYGDTLAELSPGLLDQIDDLIVKVRDLDSQITKASSVDASNVVKVQFADEIQSDIMQAAAGRKQKLLATLKKLQEEGRESTTLPELNRIGNEALAFFEKNKSVFRPLKKSETEVDIFADSLAKVDAEVDDIINRFVETREISDTEIARVKSLLNDQIDEMINDLITVDQNTYQGLFPDLPFKKREEWADALIKKDLFELAYRKFVLKDPDVPDYYAVTPDKFVIDRYSFQGNTSTSAADRAADKAEQIQAFTERGQFKGSKFKGIGMSEFYGGPNAVDENGKHYTSTIEKILKTQAKSNNSEMIILNVQTKSGGSDIYRITDQNGNMVATLTDARQVQTIRLNNPNYNVEAIRVPDMKNTTPSFAIKITEEMLEPYKTHKAKGGLVEMIDIFEVA